MKKQAAFTITELLVSVVVVAVLIALVMTSIGKLQTKANATRCLANLRAIGTGLATFGAEHNGIVMPKVPSGLVPWPPVIDSYVGGNGLAINAHTVTSPVWACPENKERVKALRKKGHADAFNTGYPINRQLTETAGDGEKQGIPIVRIQNPSRKVYVIESCADFDEKKFGPATTMEYTPYGYSG